VGEADRERRIAHHRRSEVGDEHMLARRLASTVDLGQRALPGRGVRGRLARVAHSRREVEERLRASGTDVKQWGDMLPLFMASVSDGRRISVQLTDGRVVDCSLPKANTEDWERACAQAVRTYWDVAEKLVSQTRWHHVLRAALWWAIPVALLYLLGRLVDWTYRGFRP